MSLVERVWAGGRSRSSVPALSFNSWVDLVNTFNFNGVQYSQPASGQEQITAQFSQFASTAFSGNAIVFAAINFRMGVFSQPRLQWRQVRTGGPGKLFGDPTLRPLETPWPGGTTSDLMLKALLYADLGGNCFFVPENGGIVPLRPDWVTLVVGSDSSEDVLTWDPDAQVVGIIYQPGGPGSGRDAFTYTAGQFAHFAPIPDPLAQFRGMSWLTPIIREVMADRGMTEHKLSYLDNAATPQLVIKLDTPDAEKYRNYIKMFRAEHEGAANAFRTLFLAQGADVTPVGSNLSEMDFSGVLAGGEARIASAAKIPPMLIGIKAGLEASTYSNYASGRRLFTDGTMRPLWANFCKSLETIAPPPPNAELWYDDRDVAFVQEDLADLADIQSTQSHTIVALVNAGYLPDSVIDAVVAQDWTRLEHSGLLSVQLRPPGSDFPGAPGSGPPPTEPPAKPEPPAAPATNGNNNERVALEAIRALARANGSPTPLNVNIEPPKVIFPPLPAAEVHFQEGAFQTKVEPTSVEFSKDAIRVEAAKTPDVSVHVDAPPAPNVTVAPPEVRVELAPPAAPDVSVAVEAPAAAPVTVTAPDVNVRLDAQRAPDVNVSVESPAAAPITIGAPEIRVEPPSVNVEVAPAAAPDVSVAAPEVRVNVEAPAPPDVNLTVEQPAAPDVNVTVEPTRFEEGAIQVSTETPDVNVEVKLPERKRGKRTVEFSDGRSASIEEDEEDA